MEKSPEYESEEIIGTEREYNLKCKVKVIRQTYKEFDYSGDKRIINSHQHETRSVILIPEIESTESMMFLSAWLPDISKICLDCKNDTLRMSDLTCPKCKSENLHSEWSEVPSFITSPVNSPSRLAVLRKNDYCKDHHLFVMSSGVEDELINMDGKTVYVKTFAGTQDEICDAAPDIARSIK